MRQGAEPFLLFLHNMKLRGLLPLQICLLYAFLEAFHVVKQEWSVESEDADSFVEDGFLVLLCVTELVSVFHVGQQVPFWAGIQK